MTRSNKIEQGRILARSFLDDDRAASGKINAVIAVAVGAILMAYIIPPAINEMASTSTDTWGNGAGSLFEILPVLVMVAAFLFFIGVAMKAGGV